MAVRQIDVDVCDLCDATDIEIEIRSKEILHEGKVHTIDVCTACDQMIDTTIGGWVGKATRSVVTERKQRAQKTQSNGHEPKRKSRATFEGRTIREQRELEAAALLKGKFTPHFGKKTNEEVAFLVENGIR